MNRIIHILFVFVFCSNGNSSLCQASSYTDPAAAYQRLLLETNNRTVQRQVGPYKVIGSPYLFGQEIQGDLYIKTDYNRNVTLSYNTYNQQIELGGKPGSDPLIVGCEDIDSFKLAATISKGFKEDLLFLNARLFDPAVKKPFFMQLLVPGDRYALFKAYKSDLVYAEGNYVQSELRQFDLSFDYYYIDARKPGFKKLRSSAGGIKKELGDLIDTAAFTNTDEFNREPELALKHLFAALNAK